MKKWNVWLLAGFMATAVSGCGISGQQKEAVDNASGSMDVRKMEQSTDTLEIGDETESGNQFTAWLPSDVRQVMAETEPLPELAKAIVEKYEIPEEYWEQTKYYYNYVDLNDDGRDEIFAVVMGPYTSGSGGDSGLWLLPYADMEVSQTFTLVQTPIIISDTMTNGVHELIFQRSGGGAETEYVRLVCEDGAYSNPADAEVVKDISAVTGKSILCNDLIADAQSNNYLTLADAVKAE